MKRWWIRLGRYGLSQWRGLGLILGFILLTVLMDVLKPWPLKLIVDNVLQEQALPGQMAWILVLPGAQSKAGLLAWLTFATVLLFLGGWLFRMAQQYLQTGLGARMVYALSADLFLHLQRLSLRFHGRQRTGDLVKRVTTDTDCVRQLILSAGLPLVTSLVTLVSMIAVMWKLDPALALVALLITPLLGLCIWAFAGPMERRSYAYFALQGDVTARAEQTLTALPLVRAFGQEEQEQRRFGESWRESDRASLRLTASQLQFKMGTSTVTALGSAAVIAVGGFQVLNGQLSVGSLVIFLSYVTSLYSPLETLAYLSTSLSAAAAGARRVFEVMDRDIEVREQARPKVLPVRHQVVGSQVRLENITFGYEQGHPVLRDVSLEARPGETIALVGPTGAGKSTLVALIPRLFDPWAGRVTLDGVDVRELSLESLRSRISIVLQDPFLLPLTIAENITYGRRGAARAEIIQAAEAANADEFIRTLPQGYDTMMGERGATLSGGQRQRLAIARALLKNAPVLILDEPTSAMDAATEARVLEALHRLMQGRTTFVIAHRLSTVRQANSILVLEEGRIRQRGTHEELLSRSDLYQRLSRRQFTGGEA